jgi:cathepsin B
MVKSLLLLVLPALLLAGPALRLEETTPVATQALVDKINADGDWEASLDWVGGMTIAEAKKLMGRLPETSHFPEASLGALEQYLSVPSAFDSRTQWPGCIGAIRNQGNCGSCWAFSATEVLADRICIESGVAKTLVVLSPQWLVSCDKENHGCAGGNLKDAWDYLVDDGVPLDSCDPYSSGDNDESGDCTAHCSTFYKAANPREFKTPTSIQAEILANGPVQTGFTVYSDFMTYTSGIYIYKTGSVLGGHAVKIVGWGIQGTTKYWIVANSWGTTWGLSGFFWIAFGQCGIDSDAFAGTYASS